MKDNFSTQSGGYAQFRPNYPDALIDFLVALSPNHETAWDCGTGNGQIAAKLSEHYETVFATDISADQIAKATQRPNIHYQVESAEQTTFEAHVFDLITVAQAIHWFDFERFYSEVRRTAKAEGVLAVIGYALLEIEGKVGELVNDFYIQTLKGYWDQERRFIDERYETIPFPFEEMAAPDFSNCYDWTLEQLTGYLETWSAVQHFIRRNGYNPVMLLAKDLEKHWEPTTTKVVNFPILLRLGKINS